jgi:thiamine-phosphate pyrophosphorylase
MENVVQVVRRLPAGCAVIYRHFGEPKAAKELRELTQEQGRQFLIGNDPELAEHVRADGVHFARDAKLSGPIQWRAKRPDWIITMAGLKDGAYLAPLESLDALFISSIFPSQSPSAGTPIGAQALKDRCARLPVPIYALGGVTAGTASQLKDTGATGLAAIEGLIMDVEKEDTERGHRFVIKTESGEAELTLVRAGDGDGDGVFNANHTFTPTALRGQGVAGKLYDAMVADAKAQNYKIIPGCPYVEVKFKRKPEDREAVGA